MCKTYNTIGSLTTLKSRLENNNIYDFKSVKDVIDFQNSYFAYRQQTISQHENLIEQEKNMLHTDLQQLDIEIEKQRKKTEQELTEEIDALKQKLNSTTAFAPINVFQRFIMSVRQWPYKKKIKHKEENFDFELQRSISPLIAIHQAKTNRCNFIISNFNDAVKQSALHSLSEIDRRKSIIDGLSSFIYGALGEQKVVKTLEVLSDDYILINDFDVSFSPAIYNRQENDYIKSIQIDHILVAPSGIFLIETKNWSEKSLGNLSLRSPVQQIRRTSFVLFKLLNDGISKHNLRLGEHHWGNKKIPIKNLIVLINQKPKEEFQYVKILTLKELPGYINYFKPIFSNEETRRISGFLLRINDQKTVYTN